MSIRPEQTTIRVDGKDEPLLPGMAVAAEIKTGRRRVEPFKSNGRPPQGK